MIRIAICDNNVKLTGYAEKLILELGLLLQQKLDVLVFFSGEKFCDYLVTSNESFDIVLMDIELGDITGIDAGRMLRENIENDKTILIYISSYNNYFADIIDFNVYRFIPKPFKVDEFKQKLTDAINKVLSQRLNKPFAEFSFIKNGSDIFIPIKSILYLESDLRRINLYTSDLTYTYYGNLNTEEGKLPADIFCRIHRSYLICFTHMTKITAQSITISNKTLPISTKYHDSVKIAYSRYRSSKA